MPVTINKDQIAATETMEDSIRRLYSLLCAGKYRDVQLLTGGHSMSSEEIQRAIAVYGEQWVEYPEHIELEIDEIAGTSPRAWSVIAPVYTRNEGFSDLVIELTAIDNGNGNYRLSLDRIHTL